jgi:heptosyltransferase-2
MAISPRWSICAIWWSRAILRLHVALGLKKKTVALFGRTSMAEVELYGRGAALAGDVPCLCCYHSDCGVRPSCMERLEAPTVLQAVEQLLSPES